VFKVLGTENPADLMTKVLGLKDIQSRLGERNISVSGKGHETMGEFPEVRWDNSSGISRVKQEWPARDKDRALRGGKKTPWADLEDDSETDWDMPVLIPVEKNVRSVEVSWDMGSHGRRLRPRNVGKANVLSCLGHESPRNIGKADFLSGLGYDLSEPLYNRGVGDLGSLGEVSPLGRVLMGIDDRHLDGRRGGVSNMALFRTHFGSRHKPAESAWDSVSIGTLFT